MSKPCVQCGELHGRHGLFCSDSHKAAYHRARCPVGTVKSVRRLTKDRGSVVIHFEPGDAERAIGVRVGEKVFIGSE